MLLTLAEQMIDSYFASIPRRKPRERQSNRALLIAHRGAHDNKEGIFENTLPAFNKAQHAGCWGIELDVRATADDVLVVNHDATLKRLWGHDAAIASLSFKELRQLVPEIPSLEEVVVQFGRKMHLFVELKAPFNSGTVLAQILKDLSAGTDYHLLTLDPAICRKLIPFPRQSLLLVAVHHNVRELCRLSLNESYGGVLGNYLLLTNKYIRQLDQAHQLYGVGFVNSKNSLYRELNRGISWIFTNQAIKVRGYLQQL